jgi:putative ABC transport system permease protein
MRLPASLPVAIAALRVHVLRNVLTLLGLVIGVAAIIIVTAIGGGAQSLVAQQINTLGANLLLVVPGSLNAGGVALGAGSRRSLTEDDARAVNREMTLARVSAPAVIGAAQAVNGNRNWATTVIGTTPAYLTARDWSIESGPGFRERDAALGTKVAVIGQTVVRKLFEDQDPVGQSVRLNAVPFEIVGTLASKGEALSGDDQDDIVVIPLATARSRVLGGGDTGGRAVDFIVVKATDGKLMGDAEREIRALLRQRHRLRDGVPDDFSIENMDAVMAATGQVADTLALFLAMIASISLVVGGISIMNIMLVSVTERTREIGIRMAVGARRRDIRDQFLAEALILSLAGGIGGIVLGLLLSALIGELADWPVHVGLEAIVLSFAFAGTLGVLFGLYPALRAARLDPIEALRFE